MIIFLLIKYSYIETISQKRFNNGEVLQFDGQSGLPTSDGFGFQLYYNGQALSRIIIDIIEPVRSISVGNLVF